MDFLYLYVSWIVEIEARYMILMQLLSVWNMLYCDHLFCFFTSWVSMKSYLPCTTSLHSYYCNIRSPKRLICTVMVLVTSRSGNSGCTKKCKRQPGFRFWWQAYVIRILAAFMFRELVSKKPTKTRDLKSWSSDL